MAVVDPKISVCRKPKHVDIGCFDGFDLLRDFKRYERSEEQKGIDEAKDYFFNRTVMVPKLVFPKITKMVLR